MNILFLALDIDLRLHRGDSVHVRELASHLAALGHEICLVTATRDWQPTEGVRHVCRPEHTVAQLVSATLLAREWADVVYERRLSPKVSCIVSVLCGIPFVVEVNGVLEDERQNLGPGRSGPRGSRLRVGVRRWFLRRAARLVAVSLGIRDNLVKTYGLEAGCITVIPNGANTALFGPRNLGYCRAQLGLPLEGPIVCFVGNMARWQGLTSLLEASTVLRRHISDLRILLVGGGPDLERLRRIATETGISDIVQFAGDVPYEQVPIYVGASNVCVAPFERARKASPIKVFEYMASGKPVVATNVDGVGEFVRSSGGGLVVDPDDPPGLADSIERLLVDSEKARQMGDRGRAAVLSDRSWEMTARRVAEVLHDACSVRISWMS